MGNGLMTVLLNLRRANLPLDKCFLDHALAILVTFSQTFMMHPAQVSESSVPSGQCMLEQVDFHKPSSMLIGVIDLRFARRRRGVMPAPQHLGRQEVEVCVLSA